MLLNYNGIQDQTCGAAQNSDALDLSDSQNCLSIWRTKVQKLDRRLECYVNNLHWFSQKRKL